MGCDGYTQQPVEGAESAEGVWEERRLDVKVSSSIPTIIYLCQ